MTPKQFYYAEQKARIRQVVADAGTTYSNFKQIAVAGGSVGPKLAARLSEASSGDMTELEILYPERFESEEGSAAA